MERAARFRFERDRQHWSRARSALREVLARYAEVHPLELGFSLGPFGKPSLTGFLHHFNLSHAGEWAVVAVSYQGPVGVDIERIRPDVDIAKLLVRIGEPAPNVPAAELFQIWARREARTKTTGTPLMEMPAVDVLSTDLPAPPGYAAAVAMQGFIPAPRYCGSV